MMGNHVSGLDPCSAQAESDMYGKLRLIIFSDGYIGTAKVFHFSPIHSASLLSRRKFLQGSTKKATRTQSSSVDLATRSKELAVSKTCYVCARHPLRMRHIQDMISHRNLPMQNNFLNMVAVTEHELVSCSQLG